MAVTAAGPVLKAVTLAEGLSGEVEVVCDTDTGDIDVAGGVPFDTGPRRFIFCCSFFSLGEAVIGLPAMPYPPASIWLR